jgi:DNA polymerase III epsilon subunit-like protein
VPFFSRRRLLEALRAAARAWRARGGGDVPLRGLEFVAIDIETTGLDPRTDVPVALAAIRFRDGKPCPEASYTRLVNPGRSIPAAARAIHGIGDEDVRDAPAVAAALPGFFDACRGHPLVAHTAAFDLAIVNRVARRARLSPLRAAVLDIGILAHGLFPAWWDLSLEGLARLVEVETIDRHTARGDALTAGAIFLRMIPVLERRGTATLADALRLQRRTPLIPPGPGASGGGLAGP